MKQNMSRKINYKNFEILENVIYKITNLVNGKIYIGLANNIKRRIRDHKNDYKRKNYPIYMAMRKYGLENFVIEIIDNALDYEQLNKKEIELIKYFNSNNKNIGYNIKLGGESSLAPNELKQKISNGLINSGPRKNKIFKNVTKIRGGYIARVGPLSSDVLRTEVEAAWEADALSKKLYKERVVYLNFPNGPTYDLMLQKYLTNKLQSVIKYIYNPKISYIKDKCLYRFCYKEIKSKKQKYKHFKTETECTNFIREFIGEFKAITSYNGSIWKMQIAYEKIHGPIEDLFLSTEFSQYKKECM